MTLTIDQLKSYLAEITTSSLKVTPFNKSKIHEGNSFELTQFTALDAFDIAAPLTFEVTTPNDSLLRFYLLVDAASAQQSFLEVFEDDGDITHFNVTGGVITIPWNRNRGSDRLTTCVVRTGLTVTAATADVRIFGRLVGGVVGGDYFINAQNEFILRANTSYLIRLTSFLDDNEGSVGIEIAQHRIKT